MTWYKIYFSARNIFFPQEIFFSARNIFFSARNIFFPQEIDFSARNIFFSARNRFFPQEINFSPQEIYFFRKKYFSPQEIYFSPQEIFFSARNISSVSVVPRAQSLSQSLARAFEWVNSSPWNRRQAMSVCMELDRWRWSKPPGQPASRAPGSVRLAPARLLRDLRVACSSVREADYPLSALQHWRQERGIWRISASVVTYQAYSAKDDEKWFCTLGWSRFRSFPWRLHRRWEGECAWDFVGVR